MQARKLLRLSEVRLPIEAQSDGPDLVLAKGSSMKKKAEESNRKLVLEAFDTLFNSATMRRLIGHLTTFSTALILGLAERACSI